MNKWTTMPSVFQRMSILHDAKSSFQIKAHFVFYFEMKIQSMQEACGGQEWHFDIMCGFHYAAVLQELGTCLHCKQYQYLQCAWLAKKLAWSKPQENLLGILKRKIRDTRPNNVDKLKKAFKVSLAFLTTQEYHRLIISMPLLM